MRKLALAMLAQPCPTIAAIWQLAQDADGMRQTACPVRIDTGKLVKRLRAERGGSLVPAARAGPPGTGER